MPPDMPEDLRRGLPIGNNLFFEHIQEKVLKEATGAAYTISTERPDSRFWLGKLAPANLNVNSQPAEAGREICPSSISLRFLLDSYDRDSKVGIEYSVWLKSGKQWNKESRTVEIIALDKLLAKGSYDVHCANSPVHSCTITTNLTDEKSYKELQISMFNDSKIDDQADSNIYETRFFVSGIRLAPMELVGKADSFRYQREFPVIPTNCGFMQIGNQVSTSDFQMTEKLRPDFQDTKIDEYLSFETLEKNPLDVFHLVSDFQTWVNNHWSDGTLKSRSSSENWTKEMVTEARSDAAKAIDEAKRITEGYEILKEREDVRRAFVLLNKTLNTMQNAKSRGWRKFQIAFILSQLSGLTTPANEADYVDVISFQTGGGKTEAYLGLILLNAFFDRLRGKLYGITAWSRFPLRMLSLQQTQRFIDQISAAELVRRDEAIPGSPFSVGFYVGEGATPNKIDPDPKEGKPDPDDENMPFRFRVLIRCPKCRSNKIEMKFNRILWRLEHWCGEKGCVWSTEPIPFWIVDAEIYRFLPTVLVGTLDKAALTGLQASTAGFFGPPKGLCSVSGHGFTYADRSEYPNGCLVPGCRAAISTLPQASSFFGMTLRLQDELHLLRDTLGAVDAHYEMLMDHLQQERAGNKARIIASSATLAGVERQCISLFGRKARLFPVAPPFRGQGYWNRDTDQLMRRYVALHPRGIATEFVVNTMVEIIQNEIRTIDSDKLKYASLFKISEKDVENLVNFYSVVTAYGNTIRDIEGVLRSVTTRVNVPGRLNVEELSGAVRFEHVRSVLNRLENPEIDFQEQIHLVVASSMISHGVDVDRLNTMILMGMPLTTAEFIQVSARVGRRLPGILFLLIKPLKERDISVYRVFQTFIEHADRFVDPVPITRASRRVLSRTLPGLENARILQIHEAISSKRLTTSRFFREYLRDHPEYFKQEKEKLIEMLVGNDVGLEKLGLDIENWLTRFERSIMNNVAEGMMTNNLLPGRPMTSLRDVEEQVKIFGTHFQ
ncbi:MAG TPA: helicase C-terminal domain-containing protein [bacterium]|nr:helicase C-terminal domain-containing protein [bacterium]